MLRKQRRSWWGGRGGGREAKSPTNFAGDSASSHNLTPYYKYLQKTMTLTPDFNLQSNLDPVHNLDVKPYFKLRQTQKTLSLSSNVKDSRQYVGGKRLHQVIEVENMTSFFRPFQPCKNLSSKFFVPQPPSLSWYCEGPGVTLKFLVKITYSFLKILKTAE